MDPKTFENDPLESIFVAGCPDTKTEQPNSHEIKQELGVEDIPIIPQERIPVKSERISDDEDEPSQTSIPFPEIMEGVHNDTSHSNIHIPDHVRDFMKKDPQYNGEKKRGRKKHSEAPDKKAMETKFVCKICAAKFQRINNYTIHMKQIHQISREFHACPNCPRKYEFEYELKRHMKKYTPLDERLIFPCTQCDRKFQTKVHMKRHIKYVHEDMRSFICEACGEAMHTSTILKEHMLTHSDYSPFQCKECGKCFKQKQRLKRHMEIHGEKHECIQCGLQLSSSVTLKKHLLVHTDEKPHKCEYCERSFKLRKTLQVHLNTHTGSNIYECEFCDKIFSSNSSRLKHKKKKHAEKFMEQKLFLAAKNLESNRNIAQ